ncbi:ATP-binding protein [Candidatus Hydrogenedentota bacterium]
MEPEIVWWHISEIVDPNDAGLQLEANGNVRGAIKNSADHLLRTFAAIGPGTISLVLLFVFLPADSPCAKQSRLNMYITARAVDKSTADIASILVQRGPLAQFYDIRRVDHPEIPWDRMKAACDVVRKETLIKPLYTAEFNSNVPSAYYEIQPFLSQEGNDYLMVDRVLDNVGEPVAIQICVEPADVSLEQAAIMEYAARLQDINHPSHSVSHGRSDVDYFGTEESWSSLLNNGLVLPHKKDPLADIVFRKIQKFRENIHAPHLLFHFRAMAETANTAGLVASVAAESAFKGGAYSLLMTNHTEPGFGVLRQQAREGRVSLTSTIGSKLKETEPALYRNFGRFAHMATPEELSGAFRPPIGLYGSPYCIRQCTDPPVEDVNNMLVLGFDAQCNSDPAMAAENGVPRGNPVKDTVKHVAVMGMPGAGKSTVLKSIEIQLCARRIPFIAIEPIKTEMRVFKLLKDHPDPDVRRLANEAKIYTLGRDDVSPFAYNPFERLLGIPLEEHKESIFDCLMATMPVSGPLPAILRESLDELYEEFPDPELPPTMLDFADVVDRVLARKKYSPELRSNIQAAIDIRIRHLCRGSVGRVFRVGRNIPDMDRLTTGYTILELDALSQSQACVSMLLVLTGIRNHVRSTPFEGEGPRLVIIIDEAHILAGRESHAMPSEDLANPQAHTSNLICRMLCELRGLKVGVIIADQSPSKVAEDVMRMTGTKVAFRTSDTNDREILGGAMLFTDMEMQEVSRLRTGEAYILTEGYHRPRKIRTTNLEKTLGLPEPPKHDELRECISEEAWFTDSRAQMTEAKLTRLRLDMDRLDKGRIGIARATGHLRKLYALSLKNTDGKDEGGNHTVLVKACRLREELKFLMSDFNRGLYGELEAEFKNPNCPNMTEMWEDLRQRRESVIEPDTRSCIKILEAMIKSCGVNTY